MPMTARPIIRQNVPGDFALLDARYHALNDSAAGFRHAVARGLIVTGG